MDRAELLDEVSEDLFAYVMRGEIAEHHVVPKLKPTGLDERFEDFESLVDLHFLLRPDVVDFIEKLPTQLRNIKTQTKNVRETTRGHISGRIDWHSTMTTRSSKSPNNPALFVCNTRNESYDIDENIVLKRLLSLIYNTLDDCDAYLRQEYEWVTDRWNENLELIDQIRDIFEKNVHIRRIRSPEVYEPTERMLQTAEESRSEIYRVAARLLKEHRQSRNGDIDALKQLLETTLITPDDEETLFELYVLFQYVSAIESRQNGRTSIATIESDRQEVARIESDDRPDIVLYHDNSARDRNISFIPEPIEKSDEALTRSEKVQRKSREILSNYFTEGRFELHTNRPDVIVLEIQRDNDFEYLITEIKNSTDEKTIQQGIKETLEYLAFLRQDDHLVFEDTAPFGSGWNGVLVVQDFEERETAELEEQSTIRIIQASELPDFVPKVLEEVL